MPENYFQLRPGYTPGDLDFDPLGLKPEDPEALKEMQTKESRAASKLFDLLLCVCRVDGVVCCCCLFVVVVCLSRVASRDHLLCVLWLCVACRVSRLDEPENSFRDSPGRFRAGSSTAASPCSRPPA